MTINQLFREKPSEELVYRYCHLFGLSGMRDTKWFNKQDMARNSTIQRIHTTILDDLKKLYIGCKARSYLTDIDDNLAITVLRQLVRTLGYTVKRRTTSIGGKRIVEYQLNRT